jgi:hypothetical protein
LGHGSWPELAVMELTLRRNNCALIMVLTDPISQKYLAKKTAAEAAVLHINQLMD